VGRWISRDPLDDEIAYLRAYLYAGNDPSKSDPSGLRGYPTLCPQKPPGACFWCMYQRNLGQGYTPQSACDQAKSFCKARIPCNPPPAGNPIPPPPGGGICPPGPPLGKPSPPPPPPPRPPRDPCSIFAPKNWENCLAVCKALQANQSVLLIDLYQCCDEFISAGNPNNLPLPGIPGPIQIQGVDFTAAACARLWCRNLRKTGHNCVSKGKL